MKSSSTDLSIQQVRGVGPQRARLLAKLGILTIRDALTYLPFRYEDRSHIIPISEIRPGDIRTARGKVVACNVVRRRGRKLMIFEAVLHDDGHYLKVKWFNQPFMQKHVVLGCTMIVHGRVKENGSGMALEMENPEYEIISDDADCWIHTSRVVPVYRVTEGISQKQFRKVMFTLVQEHAAALEDVVPIQIRERNALPALAESLRELHFPLSAAHMHDLNGGQSRYHRRLAFDELFFVALGLAMLKKSRKKGRGISFRPVGRLKEKLLRLLPFSLTTAQQQVMEQISSDMQQPYPMHRLLQGDVGCGKTVVALAAMLDAVECGYQAALMAPTETLAEQHYLNIRPFIEQLGLSGDLRSSSSGARTGGHSGECTADITVGTHALIQKRLTFRRLGLAVIDEQHKFGVMQRALLRKKGMNPDVLVMTATPIPRSLALTLYGDLDYSVIRERPSGRKPIATTWVAADRKEEIVAILKQEIHRGRQVYVVYPAIEDTETSGLRSALQGKEAFEKKFPEYRIGLLHGRMRPEDREQVMERFRSGNIDILVSTTVIEVGVDVPNATVMLIVHAERFGLSQLHQLRGRVGRGTDSACCILIAYPPIGEDAGRRLSVMVETNDGFRIAEEDLSMRGPGEFLGTRQAGLPELKNADLVKDAIILELARREASDLIAHDEVLRKFAFLKEQVDVFWNEKADIFRQGNGGRK